MDKNLHFSDTEFAERRRAACARLKDAGLDALLMFRQESMYYLTGYDTFGFCFFQCLVMTADGRFVLLTRSADQRQAAFTSIVDDIRVWVDGADANPANDLRDILVELGLGGAKLGVEYDSYGLTAHNGRRLHAALDGFSTLEDASQLVNALRLIKSEAEIAYVRRAAELCDAAWQAAIDRAGPGVGEGDVLADMHSAIYRGGGDAAGNEFIVGSGPGAMMCRNYTGRRGLQATDQLTLEFAGAYRHYHAAMMQTIGIGKPPPRQHELWKAGTDALLACEAALQPGNTIGDVFDAHARTLDAAGLGKFRLNACGYSLGTTYAPIWMDGFMAYKDNPVIIQPGMVYFLHMIIFDDESGLAATPGRTSLVTAGGADVLSQAGLDFVVK
ncbi:MAG: aminopeptidase P family protein [Hyphomicrobiaceae bacterium]